MNYVIWKGEDSREIKGLVICELPPIVKPQMRIAETVVDGVDGSIIEEVGYSSYDKALSIGLTGNADVDEIMKYFTGSGEIIFSNEPYKYYKATIVNQIDYARLCRFKTATVTFRVQPFKYSTIEDAVTTGTTVGSESVYVVENIGQENSKPPIRLMGEGSIECRVNDNTAFAYTFPDGETEVYIDSEKQDAYLGNVLKNRNMSGDFPMLQVGINKVAFTGTVTSVEILARSRWL